MSSPAAANEPPATPQQREAVASAPIWAVLPATWEQGGTGVLRSFVTTAWRLAERGPATWPSIPREGGGPASATLFALLCAFAGSSWYAAGAALLGFSYARKQLGRGILDSLLAGAGAADLVLFVAALLSIAAALLAASCARFVLRGAAERPSFGALYRVHCYGQAPAVFGLVGATLLPGLVELLCVLCRAHGYELVLGLQRGRALLASVLPPVLVAGLFVAGLVLAAIWKNF